LLLYLVRHGETEWNRLHRIQGRTDIPLNETGRKQALTTANLLAGRDWDAVITSPLSRAYETAELIAERLGLPAPTVNDALVERNYGKAEGMTDADLNWDFPGDTPVPGRESREEVATRVLPALIAIAEDHPDQSIVVVTHGGVIRSVLAAIDPANEYGTISNGSVHSFIYEAGALTLVAFDDPIEKQSIVGEDVAEQNPAEQRA
jgi:probable phosphoglycerate mutase